jgi:hypothetical protein
LRPESRAVIVFNSVRSAQRVRSPKTTI